MDKKTLGESIDQVNKHISNFKNISEERKVSIIRVLGNLTKTSKKLLAENNVELLKEESLSRVAEVLDVVDYISLSKDQREFVDKCKNYTLKLKIWWEEVTKSYNSKIGEQELIDMLVNTEEFILETSVGSDSISLDFPFKKLKKLYIKDKDIDIYIGVKNIKPLEKIGKNLEELCLPEVSELPKLDNLRILDIGIGGLGFALRDNKKHNDYKEALDLSIYPKLEEFILHTKGDGRNSTTPTIKNLPDTLRKITIRNHEEKRLTEQWFKKTGSTKKGLSIYEK